MERVTTAALLARAVDYGEADRVCTLLTEELGKVSALARGARRSRKRFGGALSLFVLGEATLSPPRRGELMSLERFDAREDLSGAVGADLVKVAHGSYVIEVARELWPAEQPEPEAFALVRDTLRALAAHPPAPPLLRCYELRMLGAVGLAPLLEHCVRCGDADPGDGWFDLARGGLLCQRCGPGERPLPGAARELLLRLASLTPDEAARLTQPPELASRTRELMLAAVRHNVGKELRSLEFLMQLRR